MHKIAVFVTILVSLVVFSFVYASDESLTITTYYPSPHGVYKTLRLFPSNDHAEGDACANEGEMVYNASAHQALICNGAKWVGLGSSKITASAVLSGSSIQTESLGQHSSCFLTRSMTLHQVQACGCILSSDASSNWTLKMNLDESVAGHCSCAASCLD